MCRHQKKRIKEWGGAKALILKRYLTHLPVQINRLQSQLVHTPPVFNVNGGMTTENKVTSSCAQHCLRNWPCSVIPILQHWNSVIFDHHHHLRQPFHDQFPQFRFMCLKRTADSANHNTKTRATRATSQQHHHQRQRVCWTWQWKSTTLHNNTNTAIERELLCAIATVVVVVGGGSSAAYCSGLRRLSMASNRQLIHLQRERELSIIINSDGGEYILEDVLSQEVYFLVQCKCHPTL